MNAFMMNMESGISSFMMLLSGMQWSDYLDILCVALVFFTLIPMIRSTGTMRIAWVVIVLLVATWVTGFLNMHTMNWLLNQVLAVGLIAVIVLFQPELRRMIDQISNVRLEKLFAAEKREQAARQSAGSLSRGAIQTPPEEDAFLRAFRAAL